MKSIKLNPNLLKSSQAIEVTIILVSVLFFRWLCMVLASRFTIYSESDDFTVFLVM